MKFFSKDQKTKLNKIKHEECIDRKGLRQHLGKYEITFPDCSMNFSKIKIKIKDAVLEYEYRGTSEYLDERVGSRAVRYLYGTRIKHFGKCTFDKNKGLPKNKYMTLIQYRGVESGIETEYEIKRENVKNTIVLSSLMDVYEFVYLLYTSDLSPYISKDKKTVYFKNKRKKIVLSILSPYMYDAIGESSFDISYELEKFSENGFCLIIKTDKIWIEDTDRSRPIFITFPMIFGKFSKNK